MKVKIVGIVLANNDEHFQVTIMFELDRSVASILLRRKDVEAADLRVGNWYAAQLMPVDPPMQQAQTNV